MIEFIQRFAPHITSRQLEDLRRAGNQADIDALFEKSDLPLRGACGEQVTVAA